MMPAQQEQYFRVLVSMGHCGSGKEITVARYMKGYSLMEVFRDASSMPRAKSKMRMGAVRQIVPISYDEFMLGRQSETEDLYLQRVGGVKHQRQRSIRTA